MGKSEIAHPEEAKVVWHEPSIDRSTRWTAIGQHGVCVWFTGLSGSGKSTIASATQELLLKDGRLTYILDGDNLRHGLNADLGFSAADRDENVRRVAHLARLMADSGCVVLVPLISPYMAARKLARDLHIAAGLPFVEVFVDTPIEVCIDRDPKGMYKKAQAGEIKGFTGLDDPYEEPQNPDLVLRSEDGDAKELAILVVDKIKELT